MNARVEPEEEDCVIEFIDEYARYCYYYSEAVRNFEATTLQSPAYCTEWEYVGSTAVLTCPSKESNPGGGPGGGGGGSYPPPEEESNCQENFNEIVANAGKKSEKIKVELCGTGVNTRTKCYFWKIYSVSSGFIPMYFVSKEEAIQSNLGSGIWKFDSFEHKEITKSGTEILYSASVSGVSATSSLMKSDFITYNDMAQMHLSFSVNISAVCDGLPTVFNTSTTTQQVWHASE